MTDPQTAWLLVALADGRIAAYAIDHMDPVMPSTEPDFTGTFAEVADALGKELDA
jgi:hypothetical protein